MGYAEQHMRESAEIIQKMDLAPIEKMADLLAQVKGRGRADLLPRRWRQRRQLLPRSQ